MPHLDITTLGAFQVRLGGQSLTAFRTDKVRAMLVFLAVEADRPHRRGALADMFWGSRSESAAQNNLRQALYCLREVIHDQGSDSPHLLVTPNDIQFDPGSDYRLDVKAFTAQVAACQAHHPGGLSLCESCLQDLCAAVKLYSGDFLSGFSLPDCPQFEWWLLGQQELYHHQALDALGRLGNYYESCRDYHQASSCALKKIELEPWHETAHRRLMRVLALSGQRAEAMRQFENCRTILMEEMGIEPSRETTELFETIRAGGIPPEAGTHQSIALSHRSPPRFLASSPPSPPFVGFKAEMVQLQSHLTTALSGRAQVAFISGEAGSGKTTLLAEFTRRALGTHGDLLAAVGGCNAQFGYGDPYLPFRQALHSLTGDLEGGPSAGILDEEHAERIWAAQPFILETLLAEGPNLAGIFPSLAAFSRQTHSPGGEPVDVSAKFTAQAAGSQPGQIAFFDEFTRALLAISRRYPLILALDDLHWADQGSLSLLFHLARSLANSQVLVVGSYRSEEIALDQTGERHPVQTLVNELLTQYGEMRIDLSKIKRWDFVNALLDSEPNELDMAFRRVLFQLTGGHPLFTVEQLRGMQESGALVQNQAGRWVARGKLTVERIPARVEALIAERLARLSDDCRALLDAASVQGETFSAEKLATVLEGSEMHIVELLSSELCRRHRLVLAEGLERIGDTTRSRYRFRHALYQRHLYQNLDPVLRARLHQATGEALERRYIEQAGNLPITDDSPSRLAFHFEKAGLAQKAIRYHQEAGDQAYRLAASEDAISHYNRALELLKELPESLENNRQELLILIALNASINAARGYADPELRQILDRAGDLAAKIGEIDLVSQTLYLKGAYYLACAEYQLMQDTGKQLLALGSDRPTPSSVSDTAYFLLGVGHLNTGNFMQTEIELQQIKEKNESDPVSYETSPVDRIRLLFPAFSAWALWFLGYTEQALSLNQQLLSDVRRRGYPYMLAFTLGTSSCTIHAFRGEVEQLAERAQELLGLATKQRFGFYQAWGKIFLGKAQVEKGDKEVGMANLQTGLDAFRSTGHKGFFTLMLALQAEAFAMAGQHEEGLKILSDASSLANKTGERFYEAELNRLRGELLLASSGAEVEAETCFQKALEIAREQEAKSLELRAATSLAQLWARQGKASQAGQMLREVYDWFREGFDTPDLQKAARLLSDLNVCPDVSSCMMLDVTS